MTNINHPTSYETFTDFNGKTIKFLLNFLDLGDKYSVSAQEITDNPNHRVFNGYDTESMEHALTKVDRNDVNISPRRSKLTTSRRS
jgi:hypothetical protein